MGRKPSENKKDKVLRIRVHNSFMERLKKVAEHNGGTASSESLYAIRKYVEAEEKRQRLSDNSQAALLSERPVAYGRSSKAAA